jgi:hypothetical protein
MDYLLMKKMNYLKQNEEKNLNQLLLSIEILMTVYSVIVSYYYLEQQIISRKTHIHINSEILQMDIVEDEDKMTWIQFLISITKDMLVKSIVLKLMIELMIPKQRMYLKVRILHFDDYLVNVMSLKLNK